MGFDNNLLIAAVVCGVIGMLAGIVILKLSKKK